MRTKARCSIRNGSRPMWGRPRCGRRTKKKTPGWEICHASGRKVLRGLQRIAPAEGRAAAAVIDNSVGAFAAAYGACFKLRRFKPISVYLFAEKEAYLDAPEELKIPVIGLPAGTTPIPHALLVCRKTPTGRTASRDVGAP